jgi:hypothetical protein
MLTLVAELRQETRREMTALHELAALFPACVRTAFQQLDAVASRTSLRTPCRRRHCSRLTAWRRDGA